MSTDSPFIARITHYGGARFPVRAYVFRNSLDEGYEGKLDLAHSHLLEVLATIPGDKFDYLLGAVWFNPDNNSKTIDFMGYSGLEKNWKSNPEVDPFIYRNGVFVPRVIKNINDLIPGKDSFCGTSMKMFGGEEDYRLTTKDINEYFKTSPNLGILEPPVDIGE